ncbi:Pycsar system effector family protein [Nonomuraea sp. NPDC050663]|uniref:Pycsar system effector family protein n=1 Tax=Nonomuraea sp. NPDC050663 TaxID=3364370 RepID=UPI0037ADBF43
MWWLRRPGPDPAQLRQAQAVAYGSKLLSEAREELNKADSKAQVLLGVVGIGLGAIAGGLLAGSWKPQDLADSVEWLWWAGVVAALASVGVLSGAVYPRLDRRNNSGRIMYFHDVSHFRTVDDVTTALRQSAELDLERVTHQLLRLSRIATRKYRLIRWGFWLAVVAALASLSAVVINLPLSP